MAEHQRTVLSLGLDPVEAQLRHVDFFDTADQAPVDPAGIDAELKRSSAFKVEVDA